MHHTRLLSLQPSACVVCNVPSLYKTHTPTHTLPCTWLCRVYREPAKAEPARYEHPVVEYYRGALYLQQGGYQTMVDLELKHPPVPGEVRLRRQAGSHAGRVEGQQYS